MKSNTHKICLICSIVISFLGAFAKVDIIDMIFLCTMSICSTISYYS